MSHTTDINTEDIPSPIRQSLSQGELSAAIRIIRDAFAEDVGTGDVTTLATIPVDSSSEAKFLSKESGVLSGLSVIELVFWIFDPRIDVKFTKRDGDSVTKGEYFGHVTGPSQSLLTSERLALNLVQRMSGIATATAALTAVIGATGSRTKLLDTRKTVPGLRLLDKMAVRHGGGINHRVGLYDMVMIKDNHVTASGGIAQAIKNVRAFCQSHPAQTVPIEVEVRTLDEVRQLLAVLDQSTAGEASIQRVMLDNMVTVNRDTHTGAISAIDTSLLQKALQLLQSHPLGQQLESEASGNVTHETIGAIAQTNVTFISVGAITHSVRALDISLKIQ